MALKNPKQAELLKPKRNKYGAQGFYDEQKRWWPSKWQYERYQQLEELERQGEIKNLKREIAFPCKVNGYLICKYVADAIYHEKVYKKHEIKSNEDSWIWVPVVEDCKSHITMTATYRLKKRLVLACCGFLIREVFRPKKK